jgi:hypothetical protein
VTQPPYGPPYPYGPANPYYDHIAPQPGCIPLRPLSISDIFSGTLLAIRRKPRLIVGLSAAVCLVQTVVVAVITLTTFSNVGSVIDNSDPARPRLYPGRLLQVYAGTLWGALVSSLIAVVLSGLLTVIIAEDVVGRAITPRRIWARVRPKLGGLLILSVVTTLAETVGLVLCIAPGVWLWGMLAVAVPALMLEPIGNVDALRRSFHLVSGSFWRVWGIRALVTLCAGVVSALIAAPFVALAVNVGGGGPSLFGFGDAGTAPHLSIAYVLISSVGSFIGATISAPARAGADVLLYVDLRMRKERLDVQLQQAAALAARRA